MPLNLITNPPTTFAISSDWTTLVTRSNGNMLGHGLSIPIFTLTNWDSSTTIPEVAEGSIIEVGGSFYQADSDTALTPEGGIIDGTVHIKLVPAGGGASVVPTLTNDAIPAWSANKAGWYDSDDKFLPHEMTKASAVYTDKSEYIDQNKYIRLSNNTTGVTLNGEFVNTGNITSSGDILASDIEGTDLTANNDVITDNIKEKTAAAGVSFPSLIKTRHYSKLTNTTRGAVADVILAWLSGSIVNSPISAEGHYKTTSGAEPLAILGVVKLTSTSIRLMTVSSPGNYSNIVVTSGDGFLCTSFEMNMNFLPF